MQIKKEADMQAINLRLMHNDYGCHSEVRRRGQGAGQRPIWLATTGATPARVKSYDYNWM